MNDPRRTEPDSTVRTRTAPALVRLNRGDNVAVATAQLSRSESVSVADLELQTRSSILPGHKMAIAQVAEGSMVIKYGQPIGIATAEIKPGEHVHSHNLADHHTVSKGNPQAGFVCHGQLFRTHSSQKLYIAAEHTTMAIIMNGSPPRKPANPVEILWDNPPMKITSIPVPISPMINLTV